jgi:DNA (cytosine-5)-methyltransferase 1
VRYGSVCSGIEAASIAWGPLRWSPAWFSEIDAFPSAVLAHHWPEVPNLGDMLALPARVDAGEVEAPDVLVGGTPCQAFSVAGNRESLSDARGNLTLTYVELADAIDRQRIARGEQPAIIVWENVPGVLSTKDNAFGCFLAGLAGEDVPLLPPGKRWTNAGLVLGPKRAVAWRILDAQYFGVAQRRRRVFVVASARNGFDPSQILFEFDGLRRDTAPSRETGQGFAHDVAPSLTSSGRGVERAGETRGQDPVVGCFWDGGQLTQTLDAVLHKGQTMPEKNRFPAVLQPTNDNGAAIPILEPGARTGVSTTDVRAGIGIGSDGDPMFTLQAGKQHGVAVTGQIAHALNTANNGKSHANAGVMPAIAFQSSQSGVRLSDTHATLDANNGPRRHNGAVHGLAVRRLTPRECERLQGFPDDHTLVPYRGKDAADGPRYKALGNSMAVPVMFWLGKRIQSYAG